MLDSIDTFRRANVASEEGPVSHGGQPVLGLAWFHGEIGESLCVSHDSGIHVPMNPDEAVVMDVPGGSEVSSPPRGFDALFAEEHERVYRGLLFITGSRSDAEELMQDAFLKLWERWDRVGSIDDPVAYLFRIALNGSRMRARRAMRASRRLLPLLGGEADPFEHVEAREDLRVLLRGIPDRQRTALVLTEIFGYTSEQAGEIMHVRAGTVRMLASQGRAALRGKERDEDA